MMKFNKQSKNAAKFYVSTFNSRTLSTDDRLLAFENAIKKIKYDVIGLSEVKRIGEEIIEKPGYIFYYCGVTRVRGSVGFVVNSRWKDNIIEFKSFSDRVVTLKLKFDDDLVLGFVQAYAPTSSAPEAEMDQFYEELSKGANDIANCTHQIFMADYNAKIGCRTLGDEETMGIFGFGMRNKRGQRLIEFARSNERFFTNSNFK